MSEGVVVSAASRKHIIYHRPGCMYARRILTKNKMSVALRTVEGKERYCACKYCSGLSGDISVRKEQIKEWSKSLNLIFQYDSLTDCLFIRTEIGLWKIVPSPTGWSYYLYHLNHFSKEADIEVMMRWRFHRQKDVQETNSLHKIVHYISQHDKAKQVMQEDYRKLPRTTRKQKRYYEQAKRKDRRKNLKRLDSIFDEVEKQMHIRNGVNVGDYAQKCC